MSGGSSGLRHTGDRCVLMRSCMWRMKTGRRDVMVSGGGGSLRHGYVRMWPRMRWMQACRRDVVMSGGGSSLRHTGRELVGCHLMSGDGSVGRRHVQWQLATHWLNWSESAVSTREFFVLLFCYRRRDRGHTRLL